MKMTTYKLRTEVVVISTGLFISLVTGAPTPDKTKCPANWAYGEFLSGWGCLRPIDNEFTEHTCLTSGYHITMVTSNDASSFRPEDIKCVTGEVFDKKKVPQSTTATTTLKTKLDEEELRKSKENLAKPFGCCLQGLSPSG